MKPSKNLMLELMSPNVKKLYPLDFSLLKKIADVSKFKITPYQNGIFVFDLDESNYVGVTGDWEKSVDHNDIKRSVESFFDTYKEEVYGVDISGIKSMDGKFGSERFCTMNYEFAEILTNIIKHRSVVDIIRDSEGDWHSMINVSQYFRFMRYTEGGEHFPHWDSDFVYKGISDSIATKYSLVVYFTECRTGELGFVDSSTTDFEDTLSDWNRQATNDEIYLKLNPIPFRIVLFPHHLCHTVLPFTDEGKTRIICRGDILYTKLND